jgi:hypothetical protein
MTATTEKLEAGNKLARGGPGHWPPAAARMLDLKRTSCSLGGYRIGGDR